MTYHEVGIYVRLLSFQWTEGYIPSDTAVLSRLVSLPKKQFERDWKSIAPCFVSGKTPETLVNERLERERDAQRKYRERMAKIGEEGNKKRWTKNRKNGRVSDKSCDESGAPGSDSNCDAENVAPQSPIPNPQPTTTSLPTVETPGAVAPRPHKAAKSVTPVPEGPSFGDLEPEIVVYLANAAAENKTGKITESRIAGIRFDLQAALEKIGSREAFTHGLRAANAKGAANVNYVRKAAESYQPAGAQLGFGHRRPEVVLPPRYDASEPIR